MPILAAEPQHFPHDLFDNEPIPERSWCVLHTKPRQEKSLARQLHAAQVPFFLPLVPRRLYINGRRFTSHLPLFQSYLFLLCDPTERIRALATKRVVRSLEVVDQGQLWKDLVQIRRLLDAGGDITTEDRLIPGAAVEIKSGPLAGLRGKIVESASRRRFVVEVDFIQRGASVLLDDFFLEALPTPFSASAAVAIA